VRSALLEEYDLDRSGVLDAAIEVEAVPCVVWSTIRSTYGADLGGLGFSGTSRYLGDRIGISGGQREVVTRRLQGCGQ
jgi:hypothetical protein